MSILETIVRDAALVIIGFTLLYVFSLTVLGVRESRRQGVALRAQEGLLVATAGEGAADESGVADPFDVFFLIPCLNEEAVIAQTIESLIAQSPTSTVVVIDDGSTDRTGEIAARYAPRTLLVSRTLPEAQLGKGEALNAGISAVRDEVARRGLSDRRVLVGVMDADGQLTPRTVEAVSERFADPAVGGVQLVVRIRNRDSLMLRFQDMEFWAMSGVGQLGRVASGTVSMGGNGQFTRLRALDELGDRPWSDSLTEDLDLGISLSVNGWRTTATAHAYVTQQGVGDLRRLLRQRTRWYQGHMESISRFPELLRSRYLSNVGFFELGAYLAVPWLITLPWSLIQQYLLWRILSGDGLPDPAFETGPAGARLIYLVAWYLISFSPHLFWGWLYWRRSEEVSVGRALAMCHLMIPWSYVAYAAAWSALWRIVTRRRNWVKTSRVNEPTTRGATADPTPGACSSAS